MGWNSAGPTFCLRVLLIATSLLVTSRAGADQLVFLDFDTFTPTSGPGGHIYSMADRDAVKAGLEAIYSPGLGVTFTTTPTASTHSTVYFNFGMGPYGGTSDHVDFLNTDTSDDAYVLAKPLLGSMMIPDTVPNIIRASINLAAHELGHILGLRHYDSFGPPHGGMTAGIAGDFLPPYPGPTMATTTTDHVMSLSTSIGLSPGNLMDPEIRFGFREAIKLKMAGHAEDFELPGPPTTPMTAQPMSFTTISVPNTMIGHPEGNLFPKPSYSVAVDVIAGSLSPFPPGDPMTPPGPITTDYYKFFGEEGETVTIEVMSSILAWRFMDITDPVVFLLDGFGAPVGTYFFNDDEHETTDSMLLDITLPYTGPYVIEVGPFAAGDPMSAGAYDLYVYRYTTVPEPGALALLGVVAALLVRCRGNRSVG
jgi:hypothetical protein